MAKYRKKPIVVEAVQLRRDTVDEFCDFVVYPISWAGEKLKFCINCCGEMTIINENDWVIKGIGGELYPCAPDRFERECEPV